MIVGMVQSMDVWKEEVREVICQSISPTSASLIILKRATLFGVKKVDTSLIMDLFSIGGRDT
jgi:hypothetical protein